ncbi:MAG: TetR/AcrR family transcriptional regulator C-terminal domain-containing protein [Deltaproteobacteria bacterium]|nr:TetR/AcrR family transcriptional regulator C-terminal domain-containing protein [Deltaproteobacteria bacterium]
MAATKRKKTETSERPKRASSERGGPKRASRRSSAPGLTAERIRDEALRLIDAEGLESFSTRRLGAALGCEAMAIYWYYPSKDALLDAVVEALISRLSLPVGGPAEGGDWIDALRMLARGYRRLAHEHPHAFTLLATRRFATEGTWRFLEGLFEMARRGGLDDRTTARFFRLVASYCNGVALDELAGHRELERQKESPPDATALAAGREMFPRLAAVSAYLEPAHYDDVFEFGLELLLDAVSRAPQGSGGKKVDKRR